MREKLRRETLETSAMDDREILVEVYEIVAEMNGALRRHDQDLYGDEAHGIHGLKQQVEVLCDQMQNWHTGLKVAWAAVGVLIAGLGTVIGLLA